ncbi:hypothetical protein [Dysgonomonas sp. 25]|uniref:hypothetical protein n=1 Tax=Dysgonomonas sp. 25 TaxID=2302933 RepID=UPI0013D706E5|nr:hypothetical protein [Dysgonomonas sp. 25]NDV69122.1 hypothetical protein [Dysgonomonas sp. 25]
MKAMNLLKASLALFSAFLIACGGNDSHQKVDTPKVSEPLAETKTTQETQETPPPASVNGVVNYLGAQASITFDGVAYKLAWSNPPQMKGMYYIQEYMPAGQTIEQYEDIFILDLYRNPETTIVDEVKKKVTFLQNRKKTDPTTTYKVFQNEEVNEYMVDIIVSDGNVVEWNVIRYTAYEEDGQFAGVKSFTMSKRGYNGMSAFVDKMHPVKSKLKKEFLSLPFPEVKPQK